MVVVVSLAVNNHSEPAVERLRPSPPAAIVA